MPFGVGDFRKCFRQVSLHIVPGKLDACIVFQVPVQSRCDIDVCISAYHHFVSFLVKFEEIFVCIFLELDNELLRCSRVDSLQQIFDRVREQCKRQQAE